MLGIFYLAMTSFVDRGDHLDDVEVRLMKKQLLQRWGDDDVVLDFLFLDEVIFFHHVVVLNLDGGESLMEDDNGSFVF